MNGRKTTPGSGAGLSKKRRVMTNGLVALSSAAVVAVYLVGYAQTEPVAASVAGPLPDAGTATVTAPATATKVAPLTTSLTAVPATSAATATVVPATAMVSAGLRDGTYTGTGTSRFGNIQATVVVRGGAIVSAEITQCGTSYPCSRIAALPGQVVARQSAAVDTVSGATVSALAYKAAVTAALAQAR